MSRADLVGV